MQEKGNNMNKLKRELGLVGATNVGIGAIIGAGIFVLVGVASGIAGPSVILSFMLAGSVAFLTALSSAELSSFITEAGGSFIYAQKAFGDFWGFIVGWTKTFDYIVGASVVSMGFAAYFAYFVGIPQSLSLLIIAPALPLALMIINLKGIKEASGTNNILVTLKVAALATFILVGGAFLLRNGDFSKYQPFFPNGITGMLSGAAIIFFAFIGFNTITVLSEEVKNPKKNVPRAILLSFAICTVLYIGVSVVAIGLLDWKTLGVSDAPLEDALKVATSNIFILKFISLSALFATSSVVMSSILGASRAMFSMSRVGVIPKFISGISKGGVPSHAVFISGFMIALITFQGNLQWIASIFNFGILMTFLFINLSAIKLRRDMAKSERSFKIPLYPMPPILGILTCIVLVFYLNINAIIFAAAWVLIGIIVYYHTKKHI